MLFRMTVGSLPLLRIWEGFREMEIFPSVQAEVTGEIAGLSLDVGLRWPLGSRSTQAGRP
jgi:hypothetical protein